MRHAIKLLVESAAVVAAISIAAVMIVMAYEVFCRYILGSPTDWALEVSTYLFAVSVTLGGAYTLRHHDHVGMEIFLTMFNARYRRISQYISLSTILIFSLVLIWFGIHEVRTALLFDERSLTPLAMPLAYPLSLVPIGGFLLLLQCAELIFTTPGDLRDTPPHVFD